MDNTRENVGISDLITQVAENYDNPGARLTAAHELRRLIQERGAGGAGHETKTRLAAQHCLDEVLGIEWRHGY